MGVVLCCFKAIVTPKWLVLKHALISYHRRYYDKIFYQFTESFFIFSKELEISSKFGLASGFAESI